MLKKENGKLKVTSKTPRKVIFPHLNRMQRRAMVFAHPVRNLITKAEELRHEMIESSVIVPRRPKHNNAKRWSGYYGRLCEIARNS